MKEVSKQKLVSIIVPAYNVENYIAECIESITGQTYSNIEIIVIDDGSSDATSSIVSSKARKDSRIKLFTIANSGVSAARNFGLDKAVGYYIQFVDGDDFLQSDAVEILVDEMESSDADWVNFQYYRIDEFKNPLENYNFVNTIIDTPDFDKRFGLIINDLLEYYIGYEVWNKLFKTTIIKENNIKFFEDCHIGEDLGFNICYGLFANKISCIKNRLYFYRQRNDSAMSNAKDLVRDFNEHLSLLKSLEKVFDTSITRPTKDRFYQIFYKWFIHFCKGNTVKDVAKVVVQVDDYWFYNNLCNSLLHKATFKDFLPEDKAMLYFRYGLYIKTRLHANLSDEIYLRVYNLYRRLRGRTTIGDTQLF